MSFLPVVNQSSVRDKSAGIDQSRFTKDLIESGVPKDNQVETMSQQNIVINTHSDSGAEPTACTNKQDSSDAATHQHSEKSLKKGITKKASGYVVKPSYTIPTTYVQLDDSNSRN